MEISEEYIKALIKYLKISIKDINKYVDELDPSDLELIFNIALNMENIVDELQKMILEQKKK